MKAAHFNSSPVCYGLTRRTRKGSEILNSRSPCSSLGTAKGCSFLSVSNAKELADNSSRLGDFHLPAKNKSNFSPLITHCRKLRFPVVNSQLKSNHALGSADVDDTLVSDEDEGVIQLPGTPVNQRPSSNVKLELLMLSLPALAGQAIDPLAQLMETAYIGRLGTVELASAGVSISIFNIISKLFNIPLLSVATSFVAEDIAKNADRDSAADCGGLENNGNGRPHTRVPQRKQLSSVSTALLLALGIGIFEAVALYLGSGTFLHLMGVSTENPTCIPAQQFLSLRALGAPAVVLSLALQGVFRGFKDTRTPVVCLGIGNLAAIFLFPLLMYYFQLGVTGAAISTVLSQYIVTFLMAWCLNKRAVLLTPKMGTLQFGAYVKSGGFLLGRTLAVLTTMTLGASMAARQGPVAMAAHQIWMQVWLAVSLLTDALAASGQALIASSLSRREYKSVKEITDFVLRIGLLAGVSLAAILGASFGSLATFFTQDAKVLQVVRTGVLFVSASQPFNALAYIFDGLHYGISDFPYAACSMMLVGAASSTFLLVAPSLIGIQGVWLGLTLFMALRMMAGFVRERDGDSKERECRSVLFGDIAIKIWSMVVPTWELGGSLADFVEEMKSVGCRIPMAFPECIKEDYTNRYHGGKPATAASKSFNKDLTKVEGASAVFCRSFAGDHQICRSLYAQGSEVMADDLSSYKLQYFMFFVLVVFLVVHWLIRLFPINKKKKK